MREKLFQWSAYDSNGHKVKGIEPALNKQYLLQTLMTREYLYPKCQRLFLMPGSRQKINALDITQCLEQLAVIITAGVPLLQALQSIQVSIKKPLLVWLINDIHRHITHGKSLCKAMQHHPRYFSITESSLIAMAEMTGTLSDTLAQIAAERRAIAVIKAKVRKAFTYPGMVLLIGIIVTVVLLTCIVPKFQQLYDSFQAQLPWFTQYILIAAQLIKQYGLTVMLMMILLLIFNVWLYRKNRRYQFGIDRLRLQLPVIGRLLHRAYLAQWARTLSTMIAGGIPLAQALDNTDHLIANSIFQHAIRQTAIQVKNGESLQNSMQQHSIFMPEILQMVAMGEQIGQLDRMLLTIADNLAHQVTQAVDQLSAMLEPLAMLIVGGLVGLLVVAMYLPIFEMGNVI